MSYLKKFRRYIVAMILLCLGYNLYFIFLLPDTKISYLVYLDVLMGIAWLLFFVIDSMPFYEMQKRKARLLSLESLITNELGNFENREVAAHDIDILQKELREQFDINCNLQDYIAKWCHEVKLPLAVSLLMVEKIENIELKSSLQEQLEKMREQVNAALLGSKVQSNLLDIHVQPVRLADCVHTSIRNNQFFLIRKHIDLDIQLSEQTVYTDKSWLVYALDQLLNNAIKYSGESPAIKIWTEYSDTEIHLYIEDNGEGILDTDIRRIFEKGFTGRNHHNGRYKSTGMGLYMTELIMKKLGHRIEVESEYGEYTKFCITFYDNRSFFHFEK